MRYIIGIDLGTTNSCLAYVDKENPALAVQFLKIPQLVQAGVVENLSLLPSFLYLASSDQWPKNALNLPWKKHNVEFVGQFALEMGAKIPTQVVQSAKSWLCHAGVDRKERILPFLADQQAKKVSPVEATAKYLQHLKEAWNHLMAKGIVENELEQQQVILTIPASFDEVARSLTVEAARLAGFREMTLLEEPQAAFYSWISLHQKEETALLKEGDCILVCDVGGGTTDFSLIEVQAKEEQISFQRMAVGPHLLLGGDNIDAAVAHLIDQKAQKAQFDTQADLHYWQKLLFEARMAKEKLLKGDEETHTVVLTQKGSKIIRGSKSIVLERKEVQDLLLNGFFQHYSWQEAAQISKRTGLRTMGLPYEEEPSITKHLASFLKEAIKQQTISPNYLLINGGSLTPPIFQQALLNNLRNWFPERNVQLLSHFHLEQAVARGAAYYGKARLGLGTKIKSGIAKGYYLALNLREGEVETKKALTLLARGSEEGESYEPEHVFHVLPNTPVVFTLMTSQTRLSDSPGDLIDIDELQMHKLPPIQTILRFGKGVENVQDPIPVHLQVILTPIGTLEIWLKSLKTSHRWLLEFQIKNASGQQEVLNKRLLQTDETVDLRDLKQAQTVIHDLFENLTFKPSQIIEKLEMALEKEKWQWSSSLLRALWKPLLEMASHRKKTPVLEARWWNLAGFFLRPGYGYPLDDFRVKDLWKIILSGLSDKNLDLFVQRLICLRRIAGGLNKGQQTQIANEILPSLLKKHTLQSVPKNEEYLYAEKIRLIASLELIDPATKIKLGDALFEKVLKGEANKAEEWALSRLGNRRLLYGAVVHVIAPSVCEQWVKKIVGSKKTPDKQKLMLIKHLASKTGYREVDLSDFVVADLIKQLKLIPQSEEVIYQIQTVSTYTEQEREALYGDHLPAGLTLQL